MTLQPLFLGLAFTIAAIALYTDTRRGIIPNALTFPALGLGIALHGLTDGGAGLSFALQGAALGLGLLLLPFLVGGLGAGDVKLLAALGAFVGPSAIFTTFIFAAFLGGVIGVIVLVRHYGWSGLLGTVIGGWSQLLSPSQRTTRLTGFPYASAIFFGLFTALLMR